MEWDFRVKASTDLEAKRIARNMAIEALRKKNMIGRWFEVQNVEWLQKSLFGDGVLAKVHVYVKDNKIMKNAKVKSYLAQEFRDLKARLSKKNFNDQKSKWIAGLASIKDALKNFKDAKQVVQYKGYTITVYVEKDQTVCNITKNGKDIGGFSSFSGMSMNEAIKSAKEEVDEDIKFGDSAEYINDRKIDIKKDGKLIDTVNAESLDEAVRIYERQHPELKGQIDAYFSDVNIKDFISYDKDWAERMFKAGYSARETAMRIEAYSSSTNHSEQADLINRLEKQRKEWFEKQLEEKRAGRR